MPAKVVKLSDEDSRALELLRTKGLSIKNLDDASRERLREFIRRWHVEKGLSLGDLAKLIGNKTSGYTSWVTRQLGIQPRGFEEARLAGIHGKVRKYERRPFDGSDEDKAYLLGLRHGDLSASRPFGDAIRVSVSTTHPGMTRLFRALFEKYGHVYEHPRFKKDTNSYEWNLSTILDESFAFLLPEHPQVEGWIEQSDDRFFSYLSGLLDADGSILTTNDKRGRVYVFIDFYNNDRPLLEWIQNRLRPMGYFASLRLNKPEGHRTRKYNIVHRSDYLQLSLYGMDQIHGLLRLLKPRHPEKIRRHSIASRTRKGQSYVEVEQDILDLRASIELERDAYVIKAQEEYRKTHPAA